MPSGIYENIYEAYKGKAENVDFHASFGRNLGLKNEERMLYVFG